MVEAAVQAAVLDASPFDQDEAAAVMTRSIVPNSPLSTTVAQTIESASGTQARDSAGGYAKGIGDSSTSDDVGKWTPASEKFFRFFSSSLEEYSSGRSCLPEAFSFSPLEAQSRAECVGKISDREQFLSAPYLIEPETLPRLGSTLTLERPRSPIRKVRSVRTHLPSPDRSAFCEDFCSSQERQIPPHY